LTFGVLDVGASIKRFQKLVKPFDQLFGIASICLKDLSHTIALGIEQDLRQANVLDKPLNFIEDSIGVKVVVDVVAIHEVHIRK